LGAVLAAILPVFLVAGGGYAVARYRTLDLKTLSSLNLYLFIPALVYASVSRHAIEWGLFGRYALACVGMVLAMRGVLGLVARWRGLTGDAHSGFLLTMFMNLGNFGLPVCQFAFGDEGLALAVVVMVCGSFLQNSAGVYFAQRNRYGAAQALVRVFHFPMIYAFVLAMASQRTGWQPPVVLLRAIEITAGAAIPAQLIILGVQLAETRLDTGADVFLATALRLCGGPVLALGMVWLVGLDGLAAKVYILQMSAPVAVGMTVFGVQFDVAPRFLASVVSLTFLLSVATVSVVLYCLM